MSCKKPWSLTAHLLDMSVEQFTRATQSPFLKLAAQGRLPKDTISEWLANDRLYMQGYIKLAGQLLRIIPLPLVAARSESLESTETRLLDWLVDALVNIRREERFFIDVAKRYGLNIDLTKGDGVVPQERKIKGLQLFEAVFSRVSGGNQTQDILPWLEGAIVFWATEKVYFEAWSWAKCEASNGSNPSSGSMDGGAMEREFIPNWTNDEFSSFVRALEILINEGVQSAIAEENEGMLEEEIRKRAEICWKDVLDAEVAFWPDTREM